MQFDVYRNQYFKREDKEMLERIVMKRKQDASGAKDDDDEMEDSNQMQIVLRNNSLGNGNGCMIVKREADPSRRFEIDVSGCLISFIIL